MDIFVSIFTIASIIGFGALIIMIFTIIIAVLFDKFDFITSRSFAHLFIWTALVAFSLAIIQAIFPKA